MAELTYEQKQEKLQEIKGELFNLFPNAVEVKLTVKGDKVNVDLKEDFSK